MNVEDQSRFGPLTGSEKDRFLNVGPGSDSGRRWLQAALFSISNFDVVWNPRLGCRPFHMDDRHDREFILSDDYRHLASSVLAYGEWTAQKYIQTAQGSGCVEMMEPMTAWATDTLIRFSMTRHDATDMLCSERIGDPVGTMMHAMTTMPKSHASSGSGLIHSNPIIFYMIQHMPLPIATHPFSPLQDIVNAVCYGAHGNCRVDQSKATISSEDRIVSLAPLSGTMEYWGRPCSPRLMAHVLDGDEFTALPDYGVGMLISMPGVETMNLHDAAARLSAMVSGMGVIAPFNTSAFSGLGSRLPVTDYATVMRAIRNGRYEETIPCFRAIDFIPDTASRLCVEAMRDAERPDGLPDPGTADRLPDTYAAMVERAASRRVKHSDDDRDYGILPRTSDVDYGIIPDMADIAWALTFDRPASADWTVVHDLMMAALGRGNVTLADEALMLPGAGAWSGFSRTLPLRDPAVSDAMFRITQMMVSLADRLIRMSAGKPDMLGILLIPRQTLGMFFTDMHQGAPYDFALQTMISRSFMGADRERDPDFHGLVMIMPHSADEKGELVPMEVDSMLPIPGTIDDTGEIHPDVFMIP